MMDLHNDIADFLSGLDSSLENTFAGVGPQAPDPNVYYIVVDPDTRLDNGEHSTGVVSVKLSMVQINLHTKGDIADLDEAVSLIETALAIRQFALTEHWLQACILQSINKYDMRNDPQGREEGIPDIVMVYRIAWRRLPT